MCRSEVSLAEFVFVCRLSARSLTPLESLTTLSNNRALRRRIFRQDRQHPLCRKSAVAASAANTRVSGR